VTGHMIVDWAPPHTSRTTQTVANEQHPQQGPSSRTPWRRYRHGRMTTRDPHFSPPAHEGGID